MKRLAVYEINDYLLNATGVGPLLNYPNSESIRPIVPVQQAPEMNEMNSNHPYMVYSWRTSTPVDMWWNHTDELNYVIWGKDYDSLAEIANEIMNSLRALDLTASDLNTYLQAARPLGPDYYFHYVRVLGSYSPEPPTQEAGRLGWLISIRYQYVPTAGKHLE